ncbi:MAG: bifunctional diaminohydroxyphosphoribosylaminopyrimidine deaminase/5-amino-6-(5-phosphoribosylamino)uracil reductase RibD [Gemmatimonadaceae bacterium]|nr:bifunctional diaminohydroxyphosphoribosylaminopyrimidine deaminase/5-amino-6-(5-phosphoribosylamino)uracil reductase RibD [Gemmatimonadaceae bacterium]
MAPDAADEEFMRVAINEARKGLGFTSPNPSVGAVLVVDGRVAATAYHREAGAPHAEIECLRSYGLALQSENTLYVTLEPCSTAGRTLPCTEAILRAGVRNLVIGAVDPNPRHQGRGIELLRAAGVRVRSGVLAEECSGLNEAFNKWIQTKTPFVVAKCGMTLDGRLTLRPNERRWITSLGARRHANRLRAQVDAILIGAETLRADNPRLTVREVPGARQPWRVIVSRSGRLPAGARVFTDSFAERTLVFHNEPLENVLASLGQKEITSVLMEGGGDVLSQALDQRLIDRVHIYLSPILSGGPVVAFSGMGATSTKGGLPLSNVSYEQIGRDIFINAKATYEHASSEQ